jgi:hypothetical protein
VTGLYLQQLDLAKKRVELLIQPLPNVHAATVFWDTASEDQWKVTRSAAPEFGLRLADVQLRDQPYDYEKALAHRHGLISVALLLSRPRRYFFVTGNGSQNLRSSTKSQRCLASANGSMRAAYCPMA